MTSYIVKRLLLFVPVLLCVAVLTFLLVHAAPGSPFASEKRLTGETLQALEREYGLDRPVTTQLALYLRNLAHGYLGRSIHYTDRTVNEIIGQALPVSARLGGLALIIALFVGVPVGVVSAYRRNTAFDYLAMAGAMIGISLPSFVLASVLILLFCFYLPLLPAVGWGSPRTLVLPALTLSAPYIAYIARLTRGSMLEVLKQEYIVTARAKGVPPRDLLFVHAFKNGLLPLISFLGPAAAGVLTGSVVVEKIFAIPGLGVNFVHSALHRDYFLAMGCALVYGLLLMAMNLLSDVLYGVADPRISYER
ncbi:MAG: ABC transporter permease [Fibrobacterota bacterium]